LLKYLHELRSFQSWPAAKTYCESLGMKIASINTVGKQTFLAGKFNASLYAGSKTGQLYIDGAI